MNCSHNYSICKCWSERENGCCMHVCCWAVVNWTVWAGWVLRCRLQVMRWNLCPRHYTREHHRAPSSCSFKISASCHFCISVLVQQSRLSHPVTDSRPQVLFWSPLTSVQYLPWACKWHDWTFSLFSSHKEPRVKCPASSDIYDPKCCLGDCALWKITRKHTAKGLPSSTHGLLCQILPHFKHHCARLYNILITVKCQWVFFVPLKEILMSFSQLTVWEAWYKYI